MRSLRGRLTLGILIVLTAVLVVAGLLVSRLVAQSERAALDDRLERTAELSRGTARAAVQEEVPGDDRRLDDVLSATGSSLRLLFGSSVLLDAGIPPPAHARLTPGLHTFRAGGKSYRAYVTTLSDKELGGLARIEAVTPLAGLQRRQHRLDRQLLGLGLVTLLVAGAGVWLAAELLLRPLRRLRAVASSIAGDQDLSRRVPPDDGPAELRSLAASFNAMLARLGRSAQDRERALEATRRFAADAGHELRTPLTSVQATLSTLRRHPELPEPRREAMLGDALDEQRRLVELLDGLQALARGEAAPAEHVTVDLVEVVDAAVGAVAARHPPVALVADLPGTPVLVGGWEPGLRLLAENLVENAARHGRAAGRVQVTLTPEAVLRVEDDGPGVPPDERDRVFEPFARVDGGDAPGSGLGLALVAQQARHHGATVTVGDAALGGASFQVDFGAARAGGTRA
ncbi:HAMP domain-containing histidine kinase [Baekduia soli]|uniref:histidine kinase n=1 Tax=Baekduia soli TaxID=496014 RepID=A0A5B8U9L8_9ACTN|nr:HAMP domain-containing sensor histidine kinase [Baekduia soli]QEC49342.1 HAMP domain-containing histidine kinase [Baekduia soli]